MSRPQGYNLAEVLAALPGSQTEVMAATGLSRPVVCRWLKYAVGYDLAHINSWRTYAHGGPPIRVYARGKGKAATKPKVLPNSVRVAEYRKRQRETGDWEDKKAQQRGRHWQTKKPGRDPLTAALFGTAK